MPFHIFDEQRLFQPEGAAIGERRGGLQSNLDGITLVGVGHDNKILAKLLAHSVDDANILIEIEPNFNFNTMKALLGKVIGALDDFGYFFRVERRGVNWYLITKLAAEK